MRVLEQLLLIFSQRHADTWFIRWGQRQSFRTNIAVLCAQCDKETGDKSQLIVCKSEALFTPVVIKYAEVGNSF